MAYNPVAAGSSKFQVVTFSAIPAGTSNFPIATDRLPVASNAVCVGASAVPVATGAVSVATGAVPSLASMIGAPTKVEQPQVRQASVQYAKTTVRSPSPTTVRSPSPTTVRAPSPVAKAPVQASIMQASPVTTAMPMEVKTTRVRGSSITSARQHVQGSSITYPSGAPQLVRPAQVQGASITAQVQGPSITLSSATPQHVTSCAVPVHLPGQQASPVVASGAMHAPQAAVCQHTQQMPMQGCYAAAEQGHASYEMAASPVPPQGRPPQQPLQPPQRLIEGMPDPAAIEQQKSAYARSLDVQLEQGTKMLEQQNEVQKHALRQAAEQQKQHYNVQVDQQLKAQEMSVDQQASYQLMGLQQAGHEQRAILEQQANAAVLDYEQKKVQDEFARQQYEHQSKAYEKHIEMHTEMQRHREAYVMQTRALQESFARQSAALTREAANAASPAAAGAGFGAGAGYGPGGFACSGGTGPGFNDACSYGGAAGIVGSAAESYVPALGPETFPTYAPLPEFAPAQAGVCPGAGYGVMAHPHQAACGPVSCGHPTTAYPAAGYTPAAGYAPYG